MFKNKKIIISIFIIVLSFITYPLIFSKEEVTKKDLISYDNQLFGDYEFESNKYTSMENDFRVAVNEFATTDGYKLLGKNDKNNISLFYNKEDLSFVIYDHNTNYLWNSKIDTSYMDDTNSPLNEEGDIGANNLLRKRMKSPLVVSYYIGNLKREEGLFDANNKTFTVLELNDKIGFEANISLPTSKIKLKLVVYIDDTGLNISIPSESIVDGENTKISNINVYPYFGSTKRTRIPGYVLIPDGIGALIRFDGKKHGIFNKKFYGFDLAYNQQNNTEDLLYANVYGIVHGIDQNALMATVSKGSSYANLVSTSQGIEDDFNKTYVSFEYRILFTQYLNKSKTNSVKLVQDKKNEFDVLINYNFLNGLDANYVGIAKNYREKLELGEITDTGNISLHLNVLASENRKTLFGNKKFSMTKITELLNILDDLNEEEIKNINVSYLGWQNIGYSNSNPRYKKINGSIGSKKELKELIDKYGDNIYFNVNYNLVDSKARGYSNNDIVQALDQSLMISQNGTSILNSSYGYNSFMKDLAKINKLGISNINFDTLSTNLVSDHSKNGLNREEALNLSAKNLQISGKTSVLKPFSYLWYADIIYDIPMYSSNQSKFTDTVPFIPIVLNNKETYGRTSNFFSNKDNEVLRMIDYNIYPSFYITNESSNLLAKTKSNNIYTSRYVDWKDEIISQYNYMNDALKHIKNKDIVKREIIDLGLVKNTYKGINNEEVIIYINYSSKSFNIGSLNIEPVSYEVVL